MSSHGAKITDEHSHEKSDAQTRPIFQLVIGLAIFVAIAMVLTAMLYSYFGERETALDTPVSPLAKQTPDVVHGPQLQPKPAIELQQLRAKEKKQLDSYGWVDEREHLVRIPIDRAIELMSERGLPSRAAAPAEHVAASAAPVAPAAQAASR